MTSSLDRTVVSVGRSSSSHAFVCLCLAKQTITAWVRAGSQHVNSLAASDCSWSVVLICLSVADLGYNRPSI